MIKLGYKIDLGILKDHTKVSDLLSYDGPLLSHFANSKKEHFLYYLIDENLEFYQWLIIKTSIADFRTYLNGSISLKEIIEKCQSWFVADYYNNKGFQNLQLLLHFELIEDYLPEPDSYFTFGIPKIYEQYFSSTELNQNEYISLLKENAIFIKFSEATPTHRHLVSLESLAAYLNNIKKSYHSYLADSYRKNFLELYTDLNDVEKTINRMQDNLQLRLVDAKIASFGIGISVDSLPSTDLKTSILEWTREIINDYRNEVIELDYNNPEKVDWVLANYTPEARQSIFKPILDLYSDNNLNIYISGEGWTNQKIVKKLSKQFVRYVTEVPKLLQDTKTEKEFVTVAVEVDKGTELGSIPKSVFANQPLFEKRSNSIEISKTSLIYDKVQINFKPLLILNVEATTGKHIARSPQFDGEISGTDLGSLMREIHARILEAWRRTSESSRIKPSEEDKKLASLVESLINL